MAVDLTFPVREAVVDFLRGQAPLTALLVAESIYGQMQPPNSPYPFTRFGTPGTSPLEYSCQNGSTITADLHVFGDDEKTVETIGSMIIDVLDEKRIVLKDDADNPIGALDARWTGSQTLRDPTESDVWHKVVSFEFEASV